MRNSVSWLRKQRSLELYRNKHSSNGVFFYLIRAILRAYFKIMANPSHYFCFILDKTPNLCYTALLVLLIVQLGKAMSALSCIDRFTYCHQPTWRHYVDAGSSTNEECTVRAVLDRWPRLGGVFHFQHTFPGFDPQHLFSARQRHRGSDRLIPPALRFRLLHPRVLLRGLVFPDLSTHRVRQTGSTNGASAEQVAMSASS